MFLWISCCLFFFNWDNKSRVLLKKVWTQNWEGSNTKTHVFIVTVFRVCIYGCIGDSNFELFISEYFINHPVLDWHFLFYFLVVVGFFLLNVGSKRVLFVCRFFLCLHQSATANKFSWLLSTSNTQSWQKSRQMTMRSLRRLRRAAACGRAGRPGRSSAVSATAARWSPKVESRRRLRSGIS